MKTRVAGTSYPNDKEDGGRSRQEILRELYTKMPGHVITVDLKETTHKGEKAIKCLEHKTKQCIGWIPKTKIKQMEHSQMTGFINTHKNNVTPIHYVILDEQKKPTFKQYNMIKAVCKETNTEIPAYDTHAYINIFNLAHSK